MEIYRYLLRKRNNGSNCSQNAIILPIDYSMRNVKFRKICVKKKKKKEKKGKKNNMKQNQ